MKLRVAVRIAALAATVLSAGCAESPRPIATAPETLERPAPDPTTDSGGDAMVSLIRGERRGPQSFEYPLEIGYSADYVITLQIGLDSDPGDEPAFAFQRSRSITCRAPFNGREYFAEFWAENNMGDWILMRQDRSGLYEVDERIVRPPCGDDAGAAMERPTRPSVLTRWLTDRRAGLATDARAIASPASFERAWRKHAAKLTQSLETLGRGDVVDDQGGAPPPQGWEIQRLAYPLTPGRTWVIRTDPYFGARVEGIETLTLPSGRHRAHRIRMSSELYGPDDRVYVWYGPDGFLMLRGDFWSEWTDEAGNPVGVVSSRMIERMTRLVRR